MRDKTKIEKYKNNFKEHGFSSNYKIFNDRRLIRMENTC